MRKFEFPDDWTEEEKSRVIDNPFGKEAGIPFGKLSKIRGKSDELYEMTVIFVGGGITYKDTLIYINYSDAIADKKDFSQMFDVKSITITKKK